MFDEEFACRKIFIFACDVSGITQINNKNTDNIDAGF